MFISSAAAAWFLPFVLPICLWVAYTDLSAMKIRNTAVMTLAGVYVVVGLAAVFFDALPLNTYLWQFVHLGVMLLVGIVMNMAGMIGAGDAKFVAAAAPYIALGDVPYALVILAACLLLGFVLHRIAKYTPIRRLAPDWESWDKGKKFPMGLCLGMALVAYLALGITQGA